MLVDTVQFPSGMILEIRKLKGSEINLFANEKLARTGAMVGQLLDAVTTKVVHPGPYSIPADTKPNWGKVLIGDKLYGLLRARAFTWPDPVEVKCRCESCGHRWVEPCDLLSDVRVQQISPESAAAFQAGQPLETFAVDDSGEQHAVKFRLLIGKDEAGMAQLSKAAPDEQITAGLGFRIVEIEGVHANDKIKFLNKLDADELSALSGRMDEQDAGIDLTKTAECPRCGDDLEVAIPLAGKAFFPKAKKSR